MALWLYNTTEENASLRLQLAKQMGDNDMATKPDDLIITTGSQQVLDLASKVFINEGDSIFCKNPSGRSMSTEIRYKIMALTHQYDLIVFEGNPYGEIIFEVAKKPTLKSLDTKNRVIYTGTCSKTLCP